MKRLVVTLAVLLAVALLVMVGRGAFRSPDAQTTADRHVVDEQMARLQATRLAARAESLQTLVEVSQARFDSLDRARLADAERARARLQLWKDSASTLTAQLDAVVIRDSSGTPYIPLDTAAKMLGQQQQAADATVNACRLTVRNCQARGDSLEAGLKSALLATYAADSARDAQRVAFVRQQSRTALKAGGVGVALGALLTLILK